MKSAAFALALGVVSGIVLPSVGLAEEGVLEINQACVATGCFSGDSGGFPVTIDGSAGRSYRLTSDLVTSNPNQTIIDITNSSMPGRTLDLNGFHIEGPTLCSGLPVDSCTPTGSGVGVRSATESTTVMNGSIRGMGQHGLELNAAYARVRDLTVSDCGVDGISVAGFSVIESVVLVENGDDGLASFAPGVNLTGCVLARNGGNGAEITERSQVRNCQLGKNENYGLSVGSTVGYSHNSFYSNGDGAVAGGLNLGGNSCEAVVCP